MNPGVGANVISDREVNNTPPLSLFNDWIPAFAGMTDRVVLVGKYHPNPFEILLDNFVSSVTFIFICANLRHLRINA